MFNRRLRSIRVNIENVLSQENFEESIQQLNHLNDRLNGLNKKKKIPKREYAATVHLLVHHACLVVGNCLKAYYEKGGDFHKLENMYRVVEKLMQEHMNEVNFKASPSSQSNFYDKLLVIQIQMGILIMKHFEEQRSFMMEIALKAKNTLERGKEISDEYTRSLAYIFLDSARVSHEKIEFQWSVELAHRMRVKNGDYYVLRLDQLILEIHLLQCEAPADLANLKKIAREACLSYLILKENYVEKIDPFHSHQYQTIAEMFGPFELAEELMQSEINLGARKALDPVRAAEAKTAESGMEKGTQVVAELASSAPLKDSPIRFFHVREERHLDKKRWAVSLNEWLTKSDEKNLDWYVESMTSLKSSLPRQEFLDMINAVKHTALKRANEIHYPEAKLERLKEIMPEYEPYLPLDQLIILKR